MSRLRRALLRVLVVVGLAHVLETVALVLLWRHRHGVVAALADAAAELAGGSGTGEGVPDPRATRPPSAGETCPLCGFVPAE